VNPIHLAHSRKEIGEDGGSRSPSNVIELIYDHQATVMPADASDSIRKRAIEIERLPELSVGRTFRKSSRINKQYRAIGPLIYDLIENACFSNTAVARNNNSVALGMLSMDLRYF
jgi:hypothetical protein